MRDMVLSTAFISHFVTDLRPARTGKSCLSPQRRSVTMRSRPSGGLRGRQFNALMEDTVALWRRSGPKERAGMAAVALGAATVASTIFSIVFHAGAMLTFLVLPMIFVPLALAVAATVGTILLAFMALGGLGYVAIFTPLFALSVFVRFLIEAVVIASVVGVIISAIVGFFGRSSPLRDIKKGTDNLAGKSGLDGAFAEFGDELLRTFDKQLHRREGKKQRIVARLGEWTVDDVVDELVASGLGMYASQFEKERIDGSVLLTITESDIKAEFGPNMPLGDRIKIWRWVSSLQSRYGKY